MPNAQICYNLPVPITRLAPSPTGALHLGNARTFLVNWLLARQNNWRILLRIEDLDGPRIKAGASSELLNDLRWLGLNWDEGPGYQSENQRYYAPAIAKLLHHGLAYPCICSRKEVETAASAPHAEDGSTIYPGTCRGRFKTIADAEKASGRAPSIRFAVPNKTISWIDAFAGPQQYDVARQLGDFVIAKADGTPAYQLAVVVDDAAANVTHVVRGNDLLDSTPRQMLLYDALGASEKIPTYCHLPLVVGGDGRRLAKRHGDTRLSFYRECGIQATRVITLLAKWCGIESAAPILSTEDLIGRLRLENIPNSPIVFMETDHQWLGTYRHQIPNPRIG
jgi:glutamyl-tRNA synthetase